MIRLYKDVVESLENIEDIPPYTAINFRCPEFDSRTKSIVPGSKLRKGIVLNNPSLRPDRGNDYVDVAKSSSQACNSARGHEEEQCQDCEDCVKFGEDDLSWQENQSVSFRQFRGKNDRNEDITSHLFRPDITGDICSIRKGIKVEQQETIISNTTVSDIEDFNIGGHRFRDKTVDGIKTHFATIHAAPNGNATSASSADGWEVSESLQQRRNAPHNLRYRDKYRKRARKSSLSYRRNSSH